MCRRVCSWPVWASHWKVLQENKSFSPKLSGDELDVIRAGNYVKSCSPLQELWPQHQFIYTSFLFINWKWFQILRIVSQLGIVWDCNEKKNDKSLRTWSLWGPFLQKASLSWPVEDVDYCSLASKLLKIVSSESANTAQEDLVRWAPVLAVSRLTPPACLI